MAYLFFTILTVYFELVGLLLLVFFSCMCCLGFTISATYCQYFQQNYFHPLQEYVFRDFVLAQTRKANRHPFLQTVINNYIIQRSLHDCLCSTMCNCLKLVWLAEQKIKYPSNLKQKHCLYIWCYHLFLFYRRKLRKRYLDAITFSAPVFVLMNSLFSLQSALAVIMY